MAVDFGGADAVGRFDLAVQADGKIVAVGQYISDRLEFGVVRLNPDGTLDPSFGDGGRVLFGADLDAGFTRPRGLAVQADGKIVVAGDQASYDSFGVIRLNADGSLDETFDGDGRARVDFPAAVGAAAAESLGGLALQDDGKIILVGAVADDSFDQNQDFAVARLNGDGTLDESFGDGGHRVLPLDLGGVGADHDEATAVAVQPDGKIVVVGRADVGLVQGEFQALATEDFAAVRLNPDGTTDAAFGDGGVAVVPFDPGTEDADRTNDVPVAVAVQPDGRIVILGNTSPALGEILGSDFRYAVARLDADGRLDDGFAGDGTLTLDLGGLYGSPYTDVFGFAHDLAIQPDGKIIVVGDAVSLTADDAQESSSAFAATRLNADGTPDATFGDGGRATVAIFPDDPGHLGSARAAACSPTASSSSAASRSTRGSARSSPSPG